MPISRNKLYIILGMALFAGYAWIFFESAFSMAGIGEICIFKSITGIPCPSCGSTRSVLCIVKGDLGTAFKINPLGIIVALIMIISPIWLLFDITLRKNTFHFFYCSAERFIRKPLMATTLIALVIANWIWNITKGI